MKKDKRNIAITIILAAAWTCLILSGCAGKKESAAGEEGEIILDSINNPEDQTVPDTQTSTQTTPQVPVTAADETVQSDENQTTPDSDPPENTDSQATADSGSLYEQFLRNETTVLAADSILTDEYRNPILEKGRSYTFTELGQVISAYFLNPEYTDRTSYTSAQYAYVNSPDNTGAQILLIKFIGLNIYSRDDDSYAIVAIKEDNGQLYATAEYECWARSETLAYRNGILNDYGSSGAGDHYSGISAFLSDGTVTPIYATETLYGWWTSYINDAAYQEVFGQDTEPGEFIVSINTIGEEIYYQYDIGECTEELKILCETYIDRCQQEQGINWVSDEEIQHAVKARCDKLGIGYDTINQNPEITWNPLD